MKNLVVVSLFSSLLIFATSCGATNTNSSSPPENAASFVDELESADDTLSLAGLGDHSCRLSFFKVKKNAAGNFEKVSMNAETVSSDEKHEGFGGGCMKFCRKKLKKMNEKSSDGVKNLLKSCEFQSLQVVASPTPTATPTTSASPTATPTATVQP